MTGIAKGGSSDIEARARRKLKQTAQSDEMALPAVVAVVEFGHPRSRLVKK